MKYPYALTVQACRQRQRLSEEDRARVDKLILGLRLVPTIGLWDKDSGQFNANVAGDFRVTYTLVDDPRPNAAARVVVLQIVPMTEYWARQLHARVLAGAVS